MRLLPPTLAVLCVAALLSGCVQPASQPPAPSSAAAGLVPVSERHLRPYNVSGFFSRTLEPGAFGVLPALSADVPVALPPAAGADAALGKATANLGLFLPGIPGCDWSAASLPPACRVPVIADAGPYYRSSSGQDALESGEYIVGESDTVATEPALRLGKFLIDNFVPHGYAVAQVSVLGTGDSTSCQDLLGPSEQAGLDAAVAWLGTQPWSNGNVSLIGRSYDGSTPWEVAARGNPHLKTIVPISGLLGLHELMWHNGSAEARGAGILYALYAAMTVDGTAADASQVLCPDYLLGAAEGAGAYATSGPNSAGPHTYWSDRSFLERVLANYKGSVYVIHGLQDWNVEPHMAFPAYQRLAAAGLEAKGLFGQWGHMYPDRPSEHTALPPGRGEEAYPGSVRHDWAQDLLEWFDHYLKGDPRAPSLHVEVQDNRGSWRVEATWPPAGAWLDLRLGDEGGLVQSSDGPAVVLPASNADLTPVSTGGPRTPPSFVLYEGAPLANATRIAGLAQLRLDVTPLGPGGQLFAELRDVAPDGAVLRLGHAILDLRHASGGGPSPVTPGLGMLAPLEFEPMDVLVPAGHRLQLAVSSTGEDYLPSDAPAAVRLDGGVLRLPTVQPVPGQFFQPPAWSGRAEATAPQP